MEQSLLNAYKTRVFITHSGCDRNIVAQVETYLKSLNHFEEILETKAGGVISSHCGPGTLGVLFIEKEKNYGPYDQEFDANHNGIMEADEKAAEAEYIRNLVEKESAYEEQEDEELNLTD